MRSIALLVLAFVSGSALAAEPVLRWDFEGAEEPGVWTGKAQLVEGPRPPYYPTFEETNQAGKLPGTGTYLTVPDHERGGEAKLRFGMGETLTLETWVRIEALGSGKMPYLIGKGRNLEKGAALGDKNQNYALRLKGDGKGAQVGFLFASEHPETGARNWHRWWSDRVVGQKGWHHIAITYTFGKGDSLRAIIDGKPTDGTWDMGGQTDLPPVTDASELVVGTGYSRGAEQSFRGRLDQLVLHRGAVAEKDLLARFQHVPPPPPPPPITPAMVKPGRVLVQISEEGVPEARAWPEEPEVTETYGEELFGFTAWPQKYISTGVRADRANPALFRAAAKVTLPAGKHRLLLRGRGACRLHIDGELLLETPFPPADTSGHNKVSEQDGYLDLGPDFRFAPPGNREKWCEFETEGGEHFVVLESIIGGKKRRPEFGETVVAISHEGSESWNLLGPADRRLPYTDEEWKTYAEGRATWLAGVNAQRRADCRTTHAAFWEKRRKAAEEWLAITDQPAPPELPAGYPAKNGIDHFIGARIASAAAQDNGASSGIDYFRQIQPLLERRCYDCHQGGKVKGDLRLDDHQAALAGGENEGPAVVPGDPKASALLFRVGEEAGDDIMPPKGDPLTADEIALLERWIAEGAHWPQFDVDSFEMTPPADDLAFLRRAFLDVVGVPPSEEEIAQFLADPEKVRRAAAIDRLLEDARWADNWTGYWQDVLAENPNILNPTLNNTGPFRWWIHESLLDNKPIDLFVTELIRMEGSERFGGPAGFGTATGNDVPMAAKGIAVSSAFLGVQMKCTRCHDAVAHKSLQEELFQVAAMLGEKAIKVPSTSSVPLDKLSKGGRKPLIQVTLKPGTVVKPAWPFEEFCEESLADRLAEDPADSRDRLAALLTAPQNERFAQVIVNRLWQRLMGRGIVGDPSDWEKAKPSHPDLLRWLGRRLVEERYDLKAVARIILNSAAYQRAIDPALLEPSPLYIGAAPRRLAAEQIVDSLFSATGKPFDLGELNLDKDAVRTLDKSISLGHPRKAWMLSSTSNERDRPSLSLPRITAVASVMRAFGWRGARQDPHDLRDTEPNVLQPAILANGTMGLWLTRLSDDHGITALVLKEQPVERLVERLYLRLLTRPPSGEEKARYVELLTPGYASRIVPENKRAKTSGPRKRPYYVSWSNHLDGPANTLATEAEAAARRGDPPTTALDPDWRIRMEDVLWALLNSPEWIYTP